MRIGVFDIGYRNFAFCLEEYSSKNITKLQNQYKRLAKKDKIVERKEHSPVLEAVLNNFTKTGKILDLELKDLNKGEKCGLQNSTRLNLAEYLESKKELLATCDKILIEQQFKTGVACNFDAILLGESTYSWLVFNLGDKVTYTPSRYKTCLLGCPRTVMETRENGLRVARDITKRDRKKWSKKRTIEILKSRGDKINIDYIEGRKADDVSDCILMALAWLLKTYVI